MGFVFTSPSPCNSHYFISHLRAGLCVIYLYVSHCMQPWALLIVGVQRILVEITGNVFVGLQNNAGQCLLKKTGRYSSQKLEPDSQSTTIFNLVLIAPPSGRQQNLLATGLLVPILLETTGTTTKLNNRNYDQTKHKPFVGIIYILSFYLFYIYSWVLNL